MPVVLFDSVYRKGGNYYLKVFLEKIILKKYKKFWFLGIWRFLLKYKKKIFKKI